MVNTTPADEARLSRNEAYLGKLAKVSEITICAQGEEVPASLMALCGDLEIRVPMAGVVDIGAEVKRLDGTLSAENRKWPNSREAIKRGFVRARPLRLSLQSNKS